MTLRTLFVLLIIIVVVAGCSVNPFSKVPLITYTGLVNNPIKYNVDTAAITFSIQDGDADLGQDQNSGDKFDIYLKDKRFDTAQFVGYYFPLMNQLSLDPDKGFKGRCIFLLIPAIVSPRLDSFHLAVGDTVQYELYIMDKAGNKSNTITTDPLYLLP